MHGDSLLMLTTKVVSNKKPPLLSDSESGGSTSPPALEGLVVSAICIGAAFGSALGGRISDILGRKPSLTYLSILFFTYCAS